jgi:predicted enzyme related to lactoylglutathione lyase
MVVVVQWLSFFLLTFFFVYFYFFFHSARSGKPEKGGINGGIYKRDAQLKHPMFATTVEDIDASIALIKKHGGKIVKDKFNVGQHGLLAYYEDTESNIQCVWQTLDKDAPAV